MANEIEQLGEWRYLMKSDEEMLGLLAYIADNWRNHRYTPKQTEELKKYLQSVKWNQRYINASWNSAGKTNHVNPGVYANDLLTEMSKKIERLD